PEHDGVDRHVLAAADLRVEARAELDERGDPALHGEGAPGGLRDPGEELEERRLAGAVLADHAEGGAPGHVECHAVEGGEDLVGTQVREERPREERALERLELVLVDEAPVGLRHAARDDGGRGRPRRVAHTSSGSVSRRRSNTKAPRANARTAKTPAARRPRP